ncbi:MAG: right-handed parallel beta-helix repeat-containing protein [Chloroflexota bacterium]|nr:right-handed parallel beta-helix repeat-containing protein [Chloroflexota bacterium]
MLVLVRRFTALLLIVLLLPVMPVGATGVNVTVTTTADSTNGCATSGMGTCSLRDAVAYANANGNTTIVFQVGLGGTITLGSTLYLNTSMTILGPGANVLAVDGNNTATVFTINNSGASGVIVNISRLTIQHGNAGGQGAGGGISVFIANLNLLDSAVVGNTSGAGSGGIDITVFSGSNSVVTITRSTISGNTSGAIFNEGSLTVTTSTISGNTATGGGFGGGIRMASGSATIVQSTISNNAATNGGGISLAGGSASIENTIVAGNTLNGAAADVAGAVTSLGHNLIGNTSGGSGFVPSDLTDVNPLLGPLQNNGGPAQTQALLPTSPALDVVPTTGAGCPSADQRLVSRPQNGACDIGAYELAAAVSVQANAPADGNGTDLPFATISEAVGNVVAGGAVSVAANPRAFPTYNDHVTIDRNVTITGAGASTTIVDGTNSGTIFTINAGMIVTLSGVTIQHGANSSSGGGGIANHGSLALANSVVANNGAGDGGGIFSDGTGLTLTASTVSGNTSTSSGGGIFVNGGTAQIIGSTISGNTLSARGAGIFNDGTLTLTNSTVSDNAGRSGEIGGGIDNDSGGVLSLINGTMTRNSPDGLYSHSRGSATIRDTIIAGNMGLDINGAVTSNGNNLIGDASGSSGVSNGTKGDIAGTDTSPVDPLLAPLALNAPGTTQTHALGPASPAIDAGGACPSGVTTDERGVGRPQDAACDIGAYEYVPVSPTLRPAQTGTAGQRLTFTGSGFQTGTTVTVNGASLPITVANDGMSFMANVPAHAAGTVPVVVTNPGTGHIATSTLTYAVPNAAPSPPRPSASPAAEKPIPMPSSRASVVPTGPTPNPLPPSR